MGPWAPSLVLGPSHGEPMGSFLGPIIESALNKGSGATACSHRSYIGPPGPPPPLGSLGYVRICKESAKMLGAPRGCQGTAQNRFVKFKIFEFENFLEKT